MKNNGEKYELFKNIQPNNNYTNMYKYCFAVALKTTL